MKWCQGLTITKMVTDTAAWVEMEREEIVEESQWKFFNLNINVLIYWLFLKYYKMAWLTVKVKSGGTL